MNDSQETLLNVSWVTLNSENNEFGEEIIPTGRVDKISLWKDGIKWDSRSTFWKRPAILASKHFTSCAWLSSCFLLCPSGQLISSRSIVVSRSPKEHDQMVLFPFTLCHWLLLSHSRCGHRFSQVFLSFFLFSLPLSVSWIASYFCMNDKDHWIKSILVISYSHTHWSHKINSSYILHMAGKVSKYNNIRSDHPGRR